MSSIPGLYPGQSSELDEGVSVKTAIFEYQPFVAAGTQSVLIPALEKATKRQFLLVGNGTAGISKTAANDLVTNPNGVPLTNPTQSQRVNLATGIARFFSDIEAVADGTWCVGFAVGGLDFTNVIEVNLWITNRSTSAQNSIFLYKNIASPVIIGGPQLVQPGNQPIVQLDSTNQIILQGGSALIYPNNTLAICPSYGVIFGTFQKFGTGTTEFTAGNIFQLEVKYI